MTTLYALSLKQPWAALLVGGLKTAEVRSWSTARRGRILIHASRLPDERPEAWAHVPDDLKHLAALRGGIVGMSELTACVAYRNLEVFVAARAQHLNEPDWYKPPVLYGFGFRDAKVVPFRRYTGWMKFFPVEWDDNPPSPTPSA